jgi:hypothetical protein
MPKRRIPPKQEHVEYDADTPVAFPPSNAIARLDALETVIAFADGTLCTSAATHKVLSVAETFHNFITTKGN